MNVKNTKKKKSSCLDKDRRRRGSFVISFIVYKFVTQRYDNSAFFSSRHNALQLTSQLIRSRYETKPAFGFIWLHVDQRRYFHKIAIIKFHFFVQFAPYIKITNHLSGIYLSRKIMYTKISYIIEITLLHNPYYVKAPALLCCGEEFF